MKQITLMSICVLLLLGACSDDESTNNTANNGNNGSSNNGTSNNGNNGNNGVADEWTMNLEGQEPIGGAINGRTQLSEDKLMLQFNSISPAAQGQFTVYGISAGETGTYEEIDVTLTGFPGAERCTYADQVAPFPVSLIISENTDTAFSATFTITDLACKTPDGDPAPAANGSGTLNAS